MGKISALTTRQEKIISFVNESEYLCRKFYFTGGTALSEYYLHHRYSDDLDFFSEEPLEPDKLFALLTDWAKRLKATVEPRLVDDRMYISVFEFSDGEKLKIDFCYYPYPRLKPEIAKDKFAIDSLFDIGINKLSTIGQRSTVKDFVDLYYLIPELGFWDLTYGVRKKFNVKFEPFLVSSDMLVVEKFESLPKMIKPLTLKELQDYFIDQAKKLAKTAVE